MKRSLGNQRKAKIAAAATAAMAFTVAAGVLAAHQQQLLLIDAVSRHRYGSWPAPNGSVFSVEYIHAGNKSVVCERFAVRRGKIYNLSTRYSGGKSLDDLDDSMVISGNDKEVPKLSYVVGAGSGHVLTIGDKSIDLATLCGRQGAVLFLLK